MGIVKEYIDFERGQDPKKSMRIGKASRSFEDSLEAGEYVRDNLFEITGFEEIITDPENEDQIVPELADKLYKWYKENEYRIKDKNEEDFWEAFIDWENLRYR